MVDEKDLRILEVLKGNSELTTGKISKRVNMPATTVHNRIRKMEKDGTIRKFTVDVNYKSLGKPLAAYVMIRSSFDSTYKLLERLRKNPAVEEANVVSGAFDIITKVRVKDTEELERFVFKYLRNLGYVKKTHTIWIVNGH
ncbi:Lrp/AsnC family transcriptional regulator [Candidatus Woesearchaeota archaeon]|nr:Lrp/AsnC family transcriptional regulator [Candidatus Woesearchaeota archaeon]